MTRLQYKVTATTTEPPWQYAQKARIHHPSEGVGAKGKKKMNFKPCCPSAELTDHGGKVGVSK